MHLPKVMLEACTDLQAAIEESGADISCGKLPYVQGNAALLTRVFQNLLANAIKFRVKGVTPCIRVSCDREGAEWVISIEDNGIGIEPAYRQRIFGLFQRLNTQDEYAGSGIGLATCKKIIELHGGRIWVEAAPEHGSVFYFTLPVIYAKEEQE